MTTPVGGEREPVTPAKKAPAKKASASNVRDIGSAKPTKKAAAKKAPEKKVEVAKKPATKIGWTLVGKKDNKGRVPATGVFREHNYEITGEGLSWSATHIVGGKRTLLAQGVSRQSAYSACTAHHKELMQRGQA